MVLGTMVMVAVSVQPVCTLGDFQGAFGASKQSDSLFVAKAVFDDYLEQLQTLDSTNYDEKPSPLKALQAQLDATTKADTLFDNLLESLSVLNRGDTWKRSVMDLRRSVLLNARKTNNPWPSTVWVDLPGIVKTSDELVTQIDDFLIANIDEDRTDRFSASSAVLNGDTELCKNYEKRAMERWSKYVLLIKPFINEDVERVLYPQVPDNNQLQELANWIDSNVKDESITENVHAELIKWNTKYAKQKVDTISLINEVRANFGFDPWSRGCGVQTHSKQSITKNTLLRKTAAMKELNNSSVKFVLSLLTDKLRQQFESR
ncbi:MAG: hypothetical protein QF718_06725 [Phycisphaerales bacterium]|jgi:hypothetical protein|nr:hypothetical protein [Phycisphaerales bacterium]